MPTNSFVRVFPDGTGKYIDAESLLSGGNTVQRQRIRIAGEALNDLAEVKNGSLQVAILPAGTEADTATDSGPGGDGLIALTGGPDLLLAIGVGAGTFYTITAWSWLADRLCLFSLGVYDSGTLVKRYKLASNHSGISGDTMYFPTAIKITGAATREIRVQATRLNGSGGEGHSSINGYSST